ncbi:hypothetical protein B0H13DRAFT_2311561 [Mycena leptocephala]|nr:hypothetical protein B0H13DRAFT_2311561 [Mycena leptocephala]
MQRPVISYDDITLPYHQSDSPPRPAANNSPAGPSQSKKRKWSNQQSGQSHRSKNKAANGVPKEDWVANEEEEEDEDADSRYLLYPESRSDDRMPAGRLETGYRKKVPDDNKVTGRPREDASTTKEVYRVSVTIWPIERRG